VWVSGSSSELRSVKQHLARFAKGYKFNPRYKMRLWDGKIHNWNDQGFCAIGLWREVYALCQECGFKFEIENKADFPINRDVTADGVREWCREFFHHHRTQSGEEFMPRPYQVDTAFSVLRNRYCLTAVATSGGKSFMAGIIIFYLLQKVNPDAKFLLVVPSLSLVTQFYNDLAAYNWGLNRENPNPVPLKMAMITGETALVEIPGEMPNVYIGTYQSLAKMPKEWFAKFYGLIIDEAHMAKAKSLVTIAENTTATAYYRYGMSGTFPDKDSSEILTIQSITGPVVAQVKARELMDKGVVTEVQIKALIVNHNDPEFFARVALIRKQDGKASFDLEKLRVQESEPRLKLIEKIVRAATSNTLVLFHKKDYGRVLYERLSALNDGKRYYYIDGGISGPARELIKAEMEKTDTPAVLVASYGTLSTGVSIKALQNVLFTESFKSEQIVLQSIGRALRQHEEKTLAMIFDIVDVFDLDSFHGTNPGVLHGHYLAGRRGMYKAEQYPVTEVKVSLPAPQTP
jgi:superfamily II DNA or RNA helicase